jgi:hypothetical protein
VIGAAPNCGGPGMPHRIIVNSRPPSPVFLTTGASMSGKIDGSIGKLPVVSCIARVSARIACWPFVMLYKLQMWTAPRLPGQKQISGPIVCSQMSGLFARDMLAGQDGVRYARS